jgi:hypothetical protein
VRRPLGAASWLPVGFISWFGYPLPGEIWFPFGFPGFLWFPFGLPWVIVGFPKLFPPSRPDKSVGKPKISEGKPEGNQRAPIGIQGKPNGSQISPGRGCPNDK